MTEIMADPRLLEIREIAADVLDADPEKITMAGLFTEDYDADSLLAIEILVRIEDRFGIKVPMGELSKMVSLATMYEVVAQYAQWA